MAHTQSPCLFSNKPNCTYDQINFYITNILKQDTSHLGAVNASTSICQGEEPEARNTLNPEAEILANRK